MQFWWHIGHKLRKLVTKLPQFAVLLTGDRTATAVLIHTKKCGQNCKRWQFCGHFFQLIYMAVVLKGLGICFCIYSYSFDKKTNHDSQSFGSYLKETEYQTKIFLWNWILSEYFIHHFKTLRILQNPEISQKRFGQKKFWL